MGAWGCCFGGIYTSRPNLACPCENTQPTTNTKTQQTNNKRHNKLFSSYECPADEQQVFGLNLGNLVDALSAFASASEAGALRMAYPGPEGELMLE